MNEVGQIIASEIKAIGAISFARFMELALYCPVCGYYEKEKDTPGRRGDYYTSVSVGSLFGELLAFQFADWLAQSDSALPLPPNHLNLNPKLNLNLNPNLNLKRIGSENAEQDDSREHPLQIVEAGAHRGDLARDILAWLRDHRSALFQRLEYWIIEPSPRRRSWQSQTLSLFADKVRWSGSLAELPRPSSLVRVIFSNELLDAFPVHRLGWDAKARTWFEWSVTLQNDEFVWTRLPRAECNAQSGFPRDSRHSTPFNPSRITHHASRITHLARRSQMEADHEVPVLPTELLDLLPDGFTTEVCPAAEIWWQHAAAALERGKLLTIDYGLTAEELLAPERTDGTLRAYRRHHVSTNVLADPGQQDITAHVNFSAIQAAGESTGLTTDGLLTQAQFLTQIAARALQAPTSFGAWTPEHTRQFQTLTHPEHLGRGFGVLVQSRISSP